jgi:hypothetical protein
VNATVAPQARSLALSIYRHDPGDLTAEQRSRATATHLAQKMREIWVNFPAERSGTSLAEEACRRTGGAPLALTRIHACSVHASTCALLGPRSVPLAPLTIALCEPARPGLLGAQLRPGAHR